MRPRTYDVAALVLEHGHRLIRSGKWVSTREAAAILGCGKTTAADIMRALKAELGVVPPQREADPPAPATETLSEADEGKTWVDERSGTVFTDLGQDYGVVTMTQGEFRSFRRDYSKLYGGGASSQTDLAYKYRLPSAHAVALFTRIHGIRQSSIPFTDTELEEDGVEALVDKTIESKRQQFFLQLQEKERTQQKADAEKWRAFEVNARLIASELRETLTQHPSPKPRFRAGVPPYGAFINLADIHYGKYDVDRFGEVVYNREIAERIAVAAVNDLLGQLLLQGAPERIFLLAGGSDFLHADGPKLLTSSLLTGQGAQSDGTYRQMLTGGTALMIRIVQICRMIAPVTLIDVPGNHDAQSSAFISLLLEQAFANDPAVNTVRGDGGRVLIEYGESTLYFLHGDNLKRDTDLYRMMLTDSRELGLQLKGSLLSFSGHMHGERVADLGGIKHHVCSSLSGSDSWHRDMGFTGNVREAQAFMIRRSGGKAAVFYTQPIS